MALIKRGLDLLEPRFSRRVGGCVEEKRGKTATDSTGESLSHIEMFFASTSGGMTSSSSEKSDNLMTFLVDDELEAKRTALTMGESDLVVQKIHEERERIQRGKDMDSHIARTLDGDKSIPLKHYLERHLRERATIERMSFVEKEIEAARGEKVSYLTPSFLIDGIFPMLRGFKKSEMMSEIRSSVFREIESGHDIRWAHGEADNPILSAVFAPAVASAVYQDNFQELLLPAPFRLNNTMKINPKGPIIAFIAMFSPDHDPLVDLEIGRPTTLRGLFANLLDGNMYSGFSISSLKQPIQVDNAYAGTDLYTFCNKSLEASYRAVMLTILKQRVWRSDRYPDNRFVTNINGVSERDIHRFVTIKLPKDEIIHDVKEGYWIFNTPVGEICCTKDFDMLKSIIYHPCTSNVKTHLPI